MDNCWFGFLESPYERDCYLGVPLESQTTGPQTNNYPLADLPNLEKQIHVHLPFIERSCPTHVGHIQDVKVANTAELFSDVPDV